MHWWFSGRIVPSHGTGPVSIHGQCNYQSCEFNLREQSSLHRKLRSYGKDEVINIKAPNRNINRVQDNQNIILELPCRIIYSMRIGGLVVEYYPPTVQTLVRFPTNAMNTKHFEY